MIGAAFPGVLADAQHGDEQAFATLWRDVQPALLRYFRVATPAVAEDMAAETWLGVIQGLERFNGDEKGFRSWVFTLARHRAVDCQRRNARRPVVPVPVELLDDQAAPDDPAAVVLETLSTRAALALIAELPHDQAEVVALRLIAGLDVAEVARIVGKRPGNVRVIAHRGLRQLAQLVGTGPAGARSVTL